MDRFVFVMACSFILVIAGIARCDNGDRQFGTAILLAGIVLAFGAIVVEAERYERERRKELARIEEAAREQARSECARRLAEWQEKQQQQ
ncbi:hypothetical protein EPN90_01355 [Patescibacteria group bacterium]|nr:MAG: hypothetical protein EPN90_01355 [Patescibacteria group bacterium]